MCSQASSQQLQQTTHAHSDDTSTAACGPELSLSSADQSSLRREAELTYASCEVEAVHIANLKQQSTGITRITHHQQHIRQRSYRPRTTSTTAGVP